MKVPYWLRYFLAGVIGAGITLGIAIPLCRQEIRHEQERSRRVEEQLELEIKAIKHIFREELDRRK